MVVCPGLDRPLPADGLGRLADLAAGPTPAGRASGADLFFGLQLLFNLGWSVLFFGLQRVDLALLEIGVLLALLVVTFVRFLALDRLAGWLLVPYILWTTFATALNAAVWWLNR